MQPHITKSVTQRKEELHAEINEEYRVLKALNSALGRTIKLKDYRQLKYKTFPDRDFIVLSHEALQINKLLYPRRLQSEYSLPSDSLKAFLHNNGALQVDPSGTPVSQRTVNASRHHVKIPDYPSLPRPKFVWKQNTRGFWKKVASDQLSAEELMFCTPAT